MLAAKRLSSDHRNCKLRSCVPSLASSQRVCRRPASKELSAPDDTQILVSKLAGSLSTCLEQQQASSIMQPIDDGAEGSHLSDSAESSAAARHFAECNEHDLQYQDGSFEGSPARMHSKWLCSTCQLSFPERISKGQCLIKRRKLDAYYYA